MPKELFNQTLKSALDASDRIATGVPSQTACDNIEFLDFIKSIFNLTAEEVEFDNGDLVANVYTYNHAKSTKFIFYQIQDPNGYDKTKDFTPYFPDSDNIAIDFGDSISAGTWTLYLLYIILPTP